MSVVQIKDAPFTPQEKQHLLYWGVVEADWGHPNVTLDNPVDYFRERVRLKDDPSLKLSSELECLPRLRGNRARPSDKQLRLLARTGGAKVA